MKTIYFVRHGESEANVAELVAGAELDSPLTKNGRQQALRAGLDLKDKGIQLIVSSPMTRTRNTAKNIAKAIGYDENKILIQPLFIERYFGKLSGAPSAEYRKMFSEGSSLEHLGVETTEAMHVRISKAFNWLKSLKEERIVVVSHGATGRMVRVINQELHHSAMHTVDRFANTEIYEFTL